MLATFHHRVVDEDVRGRPIPRAVATVTEAAELTLIAQGLGVPRLWQTAAQSSIDGFLSGYAKSNAKGRARIDDAVRGARESLVARCEVLIERMLPDATLVAVILDGTTLHVVTAGPGRVYLHRQGEPRRLTPRDESLQGLLRAKPVHSSEMVAPGDLVLVGTQSAFSVRAIGKVASTIETEPHVSPDVLTHLLIEPAEQARVSAAAAVLRIH